MAVGLWHQLDRTGRNLLPFAATVVSMLLSVIPMPLPGYSDVGPSLALVSVFYWAIHRPDLLRPSVVFALAVFMDLLGGLPLGLSALILIACYWALLTQRRFFLGHSFGLLWWGFAMVAAGSAVMQWVVFSLINTAFLDIRPAVFQALLATALFPVLSWVHIQLHRTYLS